MSIEQEIAALLAEDALGAAIDLATARIKAAPQLTPVRLLLIDLLLLAGELERADKQAALASTFSPADAVGFSLLRNQIRGLAAREAWYRDAALPSFPKGPTRCDELALRLALSARAGDAAAIACDLDALEAARGTQHVQWNSGPAGDLRDLDDRLPHALEVITTGGAYLWVDLSLVSGVSFESPSRPRDLAFRRAQIELRDGASAAVLIPAIYWSSDEDDGLRLGRRTEWCEGPGGLVSGSGQRCFLAGDDDCALLDCEALTMTPVAVVTNG